MIVVVLSHDRPDPPDEDVLARRASRELENRSSRAAARRSRRVVGLFGCLLALREGLRS